MIYTFIALDSLFFNRKAVIFLGDSDDDYNFLLLMDTVSLNVACNNTQIFFVDIKMLWLMFCGDRIVKDNRKKVYIIRNVILVVEKFKCLDS